MGLRRARGNDANVLASPRVHNHEQSAHHTHAKRDEPLLIRIGFIIPDRDGIGIVKDGNRFGHAYAVLSKVDAGLACLVPFETHISIVRTDCAYVNSVAVGRCGAVWGDCGGMRILRPNRKRLNLFKSMGTVRN